MSRHLMKFPWMDFSCMLGSLDTSVLNNIWHFARYDNVCWDSENINLPESGGKDCINLIKTWWMHLIQYLHKNLPCDKEILIYRINSICQFEINYIIHLTELDNIWLIERDICKDSFKAKTFQVDGVVFTVYNALHDGPANPWCLLDACKTQLMICKSYISSV